MFAGATNFDKPLNQWNEIVFVSKSNKNSIESPTSTSHHSPDRVSYNNKCFIDDNSRCSYNSVVDVRNMFMGAPIGENYWNLACQPL
jgi:hypothetical protein